ncbi:MAG: tyrosine-type recombinase/integrase [Chitinophagales bacterium]
MGTFLQLFRKFISYHENAFDYFDKRKGVTIQAYHNRYNLVQQFLHERDLLQIAPIEFTIAVGRAFFNWLLQQEYSHNYCVRVVGMCRAALHYGAAHELIQYNPLAAYRIPKLPPAKPVYLTLDEIQRLEVYDPANSMDEKARDMFLFQCYTGLDYGDLISVRRSNIIDYRGKLYISKDRNKSNIEANIPYTEMADFLFKKHDYNMRLLSNPKYNKALKDVAIDAGIDKHLTTHVGRKTYAMTMLNHNQYSIEAVSKMLGHKSVKTTETYYAQVNIQLIHKELTEKETRLKRA